MQRPDTSRQEMVGERVALQRNKRDSGAMGIRRYRIVERVRSEWLDLLIHRSHSRTELRK